MKNVLKYLIVVLILVYFYSCTDDYLDTEPITEFTAENYYTDADDVFDALVGCYDGMQIVTGAASVEFAMASEMMSDDVIAGLGTADAYNYSAIDEFDISRAPSYTDLYETAWEDYYKAVYRCNKLLQNIDNEDIDWGTEDSLKNRYEGECRFIRAYMYFQMVKLWGNIPLVTEPTTDNVEQADPDSVYALIAKDLLYACENIPNESYDAVDNGRITRWAAESMLARVFLYYTGYYDQDDLVGLVTKSEALELVEDVIASSGHSLVDDFSTLWPAASLDDYAGETTSEIVFQVKYTIGSDYDGNTDGNHWLIFFGIRGITGDFQYPYGEGWGLTVNPKLWDLYDEEDARRTATVVSIDDEGINAELSGQRYYTGYYGKKYTPLSNEDGTAYQCVEDGGTNYQIGQYQDHFVIRYSDVLLMAAELGSSNAQDYFDQVRQRAYGDNTPPSLDATYDNIMEERHKEFALEGIRYWDLLRQGLDVAAEEIEESLTVLSGGTETTYSVSADNFKETEGLSQIPNSQITLSDGVLVQNTGWE